MEQNKNTSQDYQRVGSVKDANFPVDAEGRVYHLGVKQGEVCNRVLSVGDPHRASVLANLLDNPEKNFVRTSNRGFTVHTGLYKGVPISIIATGMGIAMIDFVVRETRAIVKGPMIFIRLGTCGTPSSTIPVGSIMISKKAVLITRNPDGWYSNKPQNSNKKNKEQKISKKKYRISKPIYSDSTLTKNLFESIENNLEESKKSDEQNLISKVEVNLGMNGTADSFYSSQGRISSDFDDQNSTLIDDILSVHPKITSLEMETFHLLDLGRVSLPLYNEDNENNDINDNSIRCGACAIVLAQRKTNNFLPNETKEKLEIICGRGTLSTLANFDLGNNLENHPDCVWK